MPQLMNRNQRQPDLNQTNQLLGAILDRVGGGMPQAQAAPMPSQQLPGQGFGSGMLQMPQAQPQQQAQMPSPSQPQSQPSGNGFAPNFFNKLTNPGTRTPFGDFLVKLGIPLGTAAAGLAGGGNEGFLSGAAGFQTGYTGELSKQREHGRDLEKLGIKSESENIDRNDKRWNESYDLAAKLSKDDLLGTINKSPEQIASLADKIHSIRYTTPESKGTDKIKKEVSEKYKAGDVRNVNGVNFTRDDNGNWSQTN